jgi:hypothetical protein
MERTWKAVLKMSSEAETTTTLQRKAQRVTVTVQLLQTPPRRPRRLTSRDDLHLTFAVGVLGVYSNRHTYWYVYGDSGKAAAMRLCEAIAAVSAAAAEATTRNDAPIA